MVVINLWCLVLNGDITLSSLCIFWGIITEWVCFYYSSVGTAAALSLPNFLLMIWKEVPMSR